MKNVLKKLIMVFMIFTLVLSGCSNGSSSGTQNTGNEQGAEKVLVYGSSDYTSINPALYEHGEINSLIFSGLTAHDKNNGIVPSLAKDWQYDEASKTYTFNLRDDVKWHDGEKFTADDVKFTLEIILDPKNGSEIVSNYEDIENIEVVSPTCVKISLKAPNVALLEYLTIGMLPKHLLEGKDIITDKFNQFPIGTGPYKMKNWDMGQSITLEKNKDFYIKEPQIDTIIFKIVEDTKARALQLKSGELDLSQITPQDSSQFKDKSDFVFMDMKTADYRGIMYNFNSEFFKENRELPNILSYGIDRDAIVKSVVLGYGYDAFSPLQAGPYVNENMEKFDYNKEKAKSELEGAGWTLDSNGIYEKNSKKLSFTVNCRAGDQVRIDIANICSQQLKEIGVDMKVAVVSKVDWENQDAYLIGWGSPFDPDDHTYKVFGTGLGNNYNSYSNEKVDNILKNARETADDEERMKLYKEFQVEMAKDMPYTFICYIDAIYVSKPSIKGISTDTVLGHHGVGIFWNVADWTKE